MCIIRISSRYRWLTHRRKRDRTRRRKRRSVARHSVEHRHRRRRRRFLPCARTPPLISSFAHHSAMWSSFENALDYERLMTAHTREKDTIVEIHSSSCITYVDGRNFFCNDHSQWLRSALNLYEPRDPYISRGVAWEMAGHVHEWNHVRAVGANDRIFLRFSMTRCWSWKTNWLTRRDTYGACKTMRWCGGPRDLLRRKIFVLLLLIGCSDGYFNIFISHSQVMKLLGM